MDRKDKILVKTPFLQKVALVILGLFLTFVILEIGLRLGGFVLTSIQEHRNEASVAKKGSYTILCLGESTTANQYPVFLGDMLNSSGAGLEFNIIDKGRPGITTDVILSGLEANLDKYRPDMVISMMGINDDIAHAIFSVNTYSRSISFVESLKTCKLIRLLCLHISSKMKSIKSCRTSAGKSASQDPHIKNDGESLNEKMLKYKKSIELNPKNYRAYIDLGDIYMGQCKYQEAEKTYNKAVELDPKNVNAYNRLVKIYNNQCRFQDAETAYKKVIELDPKNLEAYICLAGLYKNQRKYQEAAAVCEKIIELDQRNYNAYISLGDNYTKMKKYQEAETAFKKAIEIDPKNSAAYMHMGDAYTILCKYPESEAAYRKSAELSSDSGKHISYTALGDACARQGKFQEAEEAHKKALGLNSAWDVKVYGKIAELYKKMGDTARAMEYVRKGKESVSGRQRSRIENYHKLKDILDERGIRYVCVQYPTRNVEPLKKIFEGQSDNIVFVDNEKIFKDALKSAAYEDYFRDRFAGDFGHCTEKGNRLLAQNIADKILKEVFDK